MYKGITKRGRENGEETVKHGAYNSIHEILRNSEIIDTVSNIVIRLAQQVELDLDLDGIP